MSVITRMLKDLEARDATATCARDTGDAPRRFAPGTARARTRRNRPGRLRRAGATGLAAALVVVATALWWQRGPDLRAFVLAADGKDRSDPPAIAAPVPALETAAARLARLEFSGSAGEAALELAIEGEPAERSSYARRGGALTVRVPAPVDGLRVPAPPADQQVFRALTLAPVGGDRTAVRLEVAASARFDLDRAPGRLVLTGHLPADTGPAKTADGEAGALNADVAPGPGGAATAEVLRVADGGTGSAAPGSRAAAGSADGAPAEAAGPGAGGGRSPGAGSPDSGSRADAGPSAGSEPTAGSSSAAQGAIHKDDRSPPAVRAQRRYREARSALSSGETVGARQQLRQALALDADLHAARQLLAVLHRRAGDAAAARDVLAEGVARAPERPGFAKPYARLLVDVGDLAGAARALAHAAPAARDDAGFHALAAAVAQRRGRHEEAAAAYTRALELDARRGRWWLGLGLALSGAGHPQEAVAAFTEARRRGDLTPRLDAWAENRVEALGEPAGG